MQSFKIIDRVVTLKNIFVYVIVVAIGVLVVIVCVFGIFGFRRFVLSKVSVCASYFVLHGISD